MVTLDYLIPDLRLKIGDINETKYRYLDEWLVRALIVALKISYRYFGNRYLINSANEVTRNSANAFEFSEADGVIQKKDEPVLVLLAAMTLLDGSLENNAWNVGSWRDSEISVSNIESGRLREGTLNRLWKELESLVTPPSKKLATARKNSLRGYRNNPYEYEGEH
jgi:hypothetical protein